MEEVGDLPRESRALMAGVHLWELDRAALALGTQWTRYFSGEREAVIYSLSRLCGIFREGEITLLAAQGSTRLWVTIFLVEPKKRNKDGLVMGLPRTSKVPTWPRLIRSPAILVACSVGA